MLFTIDIGNSHTVVGVYNKDELVAQWRVKSDRKATADEIAIQFNALFALKNIPIREIRGIAISSVVPSLEAAWYTCCATYYAEHLEKEIIVINNEIMSSFIEIDMDYPREVGADRLINGLAGWERYGSNVIVIDFGTAITFDCITSECRYIGGTILPGIAISLEALSTRAARLPHIDISSTPASVIGRNTIDAMKSGILHGYGAMIDGLVEILGQEIPSGSSPLNVIATGGMSDLIIPYCRKVHDIDKLLTLKGLHSIYRRTCA